MCVFLGGAALAGCKLGGGGETDGTATPDSSGVVRYSGQEVAVTGAVALTSTVTARKAADPGAASVGTVPAGTTITQKAQFSSFTLITWSEPDGEHSGWIPNEVAASGTPSTSPAKPVIVLPKPKPSVEPIQCTGGKKFDAASNGCVCPSATAWDGSSCTVAAAQQCTGGKVFDKSANACKCPPSTGWNGSNCVDSAQQCTGGKVFDSALNACKCPSSTSWDGSQCLSPAQQCTGGKVFDKVANACACPPSTGWNGSSCVAAATQCTGGKVLDSASKTCKCPASTGWNGSSCVASVTCTGGKVLDSASNTCKCPASTAWDGTTCKSDRPIIKVPAK
jgi:hypothetical protein